MTHRPIWVSLLAALILILLAVFLFFQSLDYFTHHGASLRIPDVKGKNIADATKLLEQQGFDVIVQDSVYYDTIPKLTVVKQFPDPDASVKVNRTVYLTVNRAIAPIIEMPNLVGMSFRNAEIELRARGLKLGDTSYKPDIAKNAVLDQIFNGSAIKSGTKIEMGSTIDLVLGAGVGNEEMAVPDLFGLTYEEARALLDANGIMLGSVVPDHDVKDTASSFVYAQRPERLSPDKKLNRIRPGQMIDIFLGLTKPERKIDSSAVKPSTGAPANEY
ncbi:MAG: penicillin-binding protein [Bacteroidetes bacterium]|nr:MAG: penicillin-binding protein [Bacteroidota bacterium]